MSSTMSLIYKIDRLQDNVREVAITYDVLRNRMGSISDKIYLTIFTESKGALTWGKIFLWEWLERRHRVPYVTMFPVRILCIALLVYNARLQNVGFLSLMIDQESMKILIFPLR